MDEIGKFWVVTKPTKHSILIDIMFEADVPYMMNQCRGGLNESKISLLTYDKNKATKVAEQLLENRK